MHKQSGNFLVQALLALTLMFAFIPMVVGRISARSLDSKMYATTNQIDVLQTAARIYVRENANNFTYDQTVISGNDLSDILEPYGLPLGFRPFSALGHDIKLVINKSIYGVDAGIELTGGDVSKLNNSELARRVGFYATTIDDGVYVGVVLGDSYSDVVRRNETDSDNNRFLNDLDMANHSLQNVINFYAHNGSFNTGQFDNVTINGIESDRKTKNTIKQLNADRVVFQSGSGESALTITRGALTVGNASGYTISGYGTLGAITAQTAAVYDFTMAAGYTSFYGPLKWLVHGDLISDRINFSVERLEIGSYLNAASGQDVYIDSEGTELVYSSKSGIETNYLSASNVTVRNQTSGGISSGASGAVLIDIRPAGTSILPDPHVSSIDNDKFEILKNPSGANTDTETCKSIISGLGQSYSAHSLAQNIICQYVFWKRLERRIDIKQCMLNGGNDCK